MQALRSRCGAMGRAGAATSRPRPQLRAVQAPAMPRARVVAVRANFAPPTVADTKAKFMAGYKKPISAVYSTVIQELLVTQHFIKYNINYKYNDIYALGFVSVFDEILESLPADQQDAIFKAYLGALGENPQQYRDGAKRMEAAASALSGPDGLVPGDGSDLQKTLADVAKQAADGKFCYNKFFAIGLFRLLELTGAKEPAALEKLVKSVNVKPEAVNRDLMLYKGVLSKLAAAKELMKEFIEREKKKQAERETAKAAKAEAQAQTA